MNSNIDKLQILLTGKNAAERELFVRKMGRSHGTLVRPALIFFLKDRNYNVRCAAINSLVNNKIRLSFTNIYPLLNDNEEIVRCEAIEYIGIFKYRKASGFLVEKLNDKSNIVRSAAATSLGLIGNKSAIPFLEKRILLEKSLIAKTGLLEGLFYLGHQNRLFDLLVLLNSRRYQVRCSVANISARLANKKNANIILPHLQSALKTEPTTAVKSSLKNAIKEIRKIELE